MMNIKKHVNEIETQGYTILDGLLSPQQCGHYVNLLEQHYKDYSSSYIASKNDVGLADKSHERVVYNLHNKHIDWWKLFSHENTISIVEPLLSSGSYKNSGQFYCNNISARTPVKNSGEQMIHIDGEIPGVKWPLKVNVIWYLNDSTKETGATRVVPGSHKREAFCEDGKIPSDSIIVEARAGDVLIFNANLWHGGTSSKSEEPRWALLLGYARWFIKPSFDFKLNTPRNIFNRVTEEQKKILGFNLFPPQDEFTRVRRRSEFNEEPLSYRLPDVSR